MPANTQPELMTPQSGLGERLAMGGKPSRAEYVHDTLRREIVSGAIPPGTRLSEVVVASELAVSRTPVREALRRLQQEGLVVKSIGGGVEVRQLSREDVAEIIGIRAVLEGYAARLAAELITDEQLARLRTIHEGASRAIANGDVEELVRFNTAFHDGIIAASASRRCEMIVGEIRDWILRYRPQILAIPDARRRSFEQHGGIIEALARRDASAAEALTRRHVEESMAQVREVGS